ncbi:MAG: coenzyme A pyrophosphatase [Nitrospinae bacterium CG11_big_fil_rev_8_21_14_0_20_56_8]|nr:MAG: coenzyme A pyrophosphatase [Nitrospinae bacterium CG11_big_fil_rev_8_21_14_0_20_56_8]
MDLFVFKTRLRHFYPIVKEAVEVHPQRAAVLVMLYPKYNRTHVLMIKRARIMVQHGGEIAFPGGVFEEQDGDLLATALRETHEELGIEVGEFNVMGRLPQVETLSGYDVAPFVALMEEPPVFGKVSSREVEEVLEMPLTPLLSTQQRDVGYKPSEQMFAYWFGHHRIWGASARILHYIAQLSS